jgi:uncharacterized protein YecT (DUF1311 family)
MKVKLILLCALLLGGVLVPGGLAQKGQGQKNPCNDKTAMETTFGQKECAKYEYDLADAELNRVYGQLVSKMADAGETESLKKAQRAWIAFRDAQCDFEAYLNQGGTIYGLVVTGCQTDQTKKRTAELRQIIKDRDAL